MIVHNPHYQVIGCTICKETVELRRDVTEAPELFAMMKQELERDHAPCEQFPNDPARAKAERKFCAGMRAAFRKPDVARPVFARCRRPR